MRIALPSMLSCLAVLLAVALAPARALDWVMPEPPPLAKELAGADLVVVGILYNGDAEADAGRGTTEVAIQTILKGHPGLKNKKHFTLKRYVPTKNDRPTYFVLFGAVVEGEVDVYRGIPCGGTDDELVGYLKGIRKLETAGTSEQLAFYFGRLEHRHREIAQDACRAFHNATYADLKSASEAYDPEKLKGWLADAKVPDDHKELYRVLFVFCQTSPKR